MKGSEQNPQCSFSVCFVVAVTMKWPQPLGPWSSTQHPLPTSSQQPDPEEALTVEIRDLRQPAQGHGQLILGRNQDSPACCSHSRAQRLRAVKTQLSPYLKEKTRQPCAWLSCGQFSAAAGIQALLRAELGAQTHLHARGQTARHGCGRATSYGQCWPLDSCMSESEKIIGGGKKSKPQREVMVSDWMFQMASQARSTWFKLREATKTLETCGWKASLDTQFPKHRCLSRKEKRMVGSWQTLQDQGKTAFRPLAELETRGDWLLLWPRGRGMLQSPWKRPHALRNIPREGHATERHQHVYRSQSFRGGKVKENEWKCMGHVHRRRKNVSWGCCKEQYIHVWQRDTWGGLWGPLPALGG